VIIPDISTNAAQHADNISQRNGWGWILWYLPVLFLAVAWGWTVLVKRKRINADS
jgi:cytochrome c-type biogenesis protein CcmH/NrfF